MKSPAECLGTIPNTTFLCGEGGNYCCATCMQKGTEREKRAAAQTYSGSELLATPTARIGK